MQKQVRLKEIEAGYVAFYFNGFSAFVHQMIEEQMKIRPLPSNISVELAKIDSKIADLMVKRQILETMIAKDHSHRTMD